MDIKQIEISKGQNQNFLDLVHTSMMEKCKKYQKRSKGPENLFKNLDGRNPQQFVQDAFLPLKQYSDKIAVVIDGSTTRGFASPSQASLYCQQLGLKPDAAFDMVEACNGFARALETAYMMYLTKPELNDKYILIINNEQPPETRAVLPDDVSDYKAVASYYVGLTFSNICTCTLLEKSDNHSWKFYHYTQTDYATNINIPLPQIASGYEPTPEHFEILLNEQYGQFCIPSFHDQINKAMFVLSIMEKNQQFWKEANVFTHTFSRYVYERFFQDSNINKLCLYYNETGNLGSCSMPFILHDQYNNNVKQGQNISFVGNGAGGSNVVVTYIHQDKNSKAYVPLMEQKILNKHYIVGKIQLRKKIRQLFGVYKEFPTVSWQNQDHDKDGEFPGMLEPSQIKQNINNNDSSSIGSNSDSTQNSTIESKTLINSQQNI